MAKDKTDAGSFKLKYELATRDPNAEGLIKAKMKHNQGKVTVDISGGIPEFTEVDLLKITPLISGKIDEMNNALATQNSGHVSTLRLIATYCNELATFLEVGEAVGD